MNLDYFIKGLRLVRMLNFDPASRLGPLRVDIAATSACNYHCIFCGTHSYLLKHQSEPQYLDESILKQLLLNLRNLGTKEVLFAGNGEPLLSSTLLKLIRHNDNGINLEIMTNGSLLDRIDSDLFRKLSKITISLNSGNGKTHQVTHGYQGENQFMEIKRNIQRLLDHPGGSKKIELNYVITKDNQNELDDFKAMADQWGVIYHARPFDTRFLEYPQSVKSSSDLRPCYIGFIQPSITASGNLLQCCGYVRKPMGNLYEKGIKEIWQSETAREMRFTAATMGQTGKPFHQDCYGCANAIASSERFHKYYSMIPILGKGK